MYRELLSSGLAVLLLLAAPARADPWLDAVRAEARAQPPLAFERVAELQDRLGRLVRRVDRYDPARPRGERWTLVSLDGRAPTPAEAAQHRQEMAAAPVPSVARLAHMLDAPHVREERPDGSRIYRFARLPDGTVAAHGFDLSARLAAEATVREIDGRPTLIRMQMRAPQPFRVMMVARMDRFESDTAYARDARGRLIIERQTLAVENVVPMRGAAGHAMDARFRTL